MRKFYFLVLAVFFTGFCFAQQIPDEQWSQTYGDSGDEEIMDIIPAIDSNGYVAIGYYTTQVTNSKELWLFQIDEQGEIVWEADLGGEKDECGYSVCATIEGNYAITGYTESEGKGKKDILVAVFTKDGTVMWKRTYGGDKDDIGGKIFQRYDSTYIVGANTKSRGPGAGDIYIFVTNGEKRELKKKAFGGTRPEYFGDLAYFPADSSYFILGSSHSFSNGQSDCWYTNYTKDYKSNYKVNLGGEDFDYTTKVFIDDDGGVIILGHSRSESKGMYDGWIIKYDIFFTPEWDFKFGGKQDDKFEGMCQDKDGNYFIVGATRSQGEGRNDGWLMCLNKIGEVQWEMTYGGQKDDYFHGILPTKDGGYLLYGYTKSESMDGKDAWILKLK